MANAQVADGSLTGTDLGDESVTGADVADGTIGLDDLTGGGDDAELPAQPRRAGGRVPDRVHQPRHRQRRPARGPDADRSGVVGAASISASPVVLNLSGNATLPMRNRGFAAFNTDAPVLDHDLI